MATGRPAMLISTRSSGRSDRPDRTATPSPAASSFYAKDRRLSTLPSPPLSPQDSTQHFNSFLPLSLNTIQQDNHDSSTVDMTEPKNVPLDLQDKQLQQDMHMRNDHETNTVTTPVKTTLTSSSKNLSSQPILPSQLRKHHESMKLLGKMTQQNQQQQQQQQLQSLQQSHQQENQVQEQLPPPPQTDLGDSSQRRQPLHDSDASVSPLSLPPLPTASQPTDQNAQTKTMDKDVHTPPSSIKKARFEDTILSPTLPGENSEDEDHDSQGTESPIEMSSPSYHSSGALIRAKSFSMFESSSDSLMGGGGRHYQPYSNRNSFMNPYYNASMDFPEIVIPTRDWIKMQTRINSLETEIVHVTRTNQLLNQELDKVSGHLQRLTSENGEGWRNEYEFLVQQVDLMHRQLQIAHSQSSFEAEGNGHQGQLVRGQPEMTRKLHAEVKDLTASLKSWQTAFQQADEKYRRKCDGERELKQTLREREIQLSSLVEKLSGYENEFKKSMSNYEQLARLTSELEALDGKRKLAEGDRSTVTTASMSTSTSTLAQSSSSTQSSTTATNAHIYPVSKQSGMPGHFPDTNSQRQPAPSTDHLTVSILSWAALLATYILS
ncbi:hypothetical protein K457DRAFT_22166 [Linnemannia elongata AG-77]|uniref:Uncharacterized protein n=1 Tax=Linnemannia elongata AG-77 TaxID=1314771 RepID=A0A197JQ81_9FUNG|nr:hypothetical protein K457DRAFT_22166 [Linnemannia elongata AG-77]